MALNKEYFETAQMLLARRRADNKRIEDDRRAEIGSAIPEYGALENTLADTMIRVVSTITDKKSDSSETVKQALADNIKIQEQMSALLMQRGYPSDYLAPVYTCAKCKDTGTYDGKWCECFKRLLNQTAAKEMNERSPLKLCSFDSFRLELYSKEIDSEFGESPYKIMKMNLEDCVKFTENFSGSGSGLLMMGNTGLGKTHLSLAVANELIEKGFCVIYGSVPEILRRLDEEQFRGAEGDTMSLISECDLLILDDLGAENNTDRYTSLLYEIINSRQIRSMPMIVNTNLSRGQIKAMYQDRLWSRLFSLRVLIFCGRDNRLNSNRQM